MQTCIFYYVWKCVKCQKWFGTKVEKPIIDIPFSHRAIIVRRLALGEKLHCPWNPEEAEVRSLVKNGIVRCPKDKNHAVEFVPFKPDKVREWQNHVWVNTEAPF